MFRQLTAAFFTHPRELPLCYLLKVCCLVPNFPWHAVFTEICSFVFAISILLICHLSWSATPLLFCPSPSPMPSPLPFPPGYLAVSLLLHENHELIMLLINTIQKVRVCVCVRACMRACCVCVCVSVSVCMTCLNASVYSRVCTYVCLMCVLVWQFSRQSVVMV